MEEKVSQTESVEEEKVSQTGNAEVRPQLSRERRDTQPKCVFKFTWAGRASFIEIATYFETMAPDHYMQARPIELS